MRLLRDSNASNTDDTAENTLELQSIWVPNHVVPAASELLINFHTYSSRLILPNPIPLTWPWCHAVIEKALDLFDFLARNVVHFEYWHCKTNSCTIYDGTLRSPCTV